MSLLSSLRTVLILSDEGLQLYSISPSKTRFIESVPWDTIDFEESLVTLLTKKMSQETCGHFKWYG